MFQLPKQKFLLNLRPDCDCVPRNGQEGREMELYCIEGKKMRDSELEQQYEQGHFTERVWEQVVFSVHEAKSVRFDFRKLRIEKFYCLREKRIGRLLHPYLTRIQQRFGQYLAAAGAAPHSRTCCSHCSQRRAPVRINHERVVAPGRHREIR